MKTDSGNRWEHGSFFDDRQQPIANELDPLFHGAALFGTGRGALRHALELGAARGWRRLVVPTYYCQDVVRFVAPHIGIRLYDHGPSSSETVLTLEPGEVGLVVEYFGARATVRVSGVDGDVLLDRTHDPLAAWKYRQSPTMTFASLRKTLPLADGGALWLSNGEAPRQPSSSPEIESASGSMREAMAAKADYLDGASISKSTYLEAHAAAELALTRAGGGAMTSQSKARLRGLPIRDLRRRRRENLEAFRGAFDGRVGALHQHEFPAFIVLSAPDRVTRDRIRTELTRRRIYSAVYWPLDGVEAADQELDFSHQMLILHADHRYTVEDMLRVAAEVAVVADASHEKDSS